MVLARTLPTTNGTVAKSAITSATDVATTARENRSQFITASPFTWDSFSLAPRCLSPVRRLSQICRRVFMSRAGHGQQRTLRSRSTSTGMAHVLLVEDEIELARVITRELENAGFNVHHAPDGESALHLFTETADEPADIVVLDWMLPGIDGLEVLRRL